MSTPDPSSSDSGAQPPASVPPAAPGVMSAGGATPGAPPPLPPLLSDIPGLLARSVGASRTHWFWYGAGVFLLVVFGSAYLSSQSAALATAMRLLSAVMMLLVTLAVILLTAAVVRNQRAEQQRVEGLAELVQLRRWPEAALELQSLLSHPMRSPGARAQSLIYLTTVLARYHRFDDAIAVHDHLLSTVRLDPRTAHALRLGRAMAMLRADHLFDADRAIADLRRQVLRGGRAARSDVEAADDNEQEAVFAPIELGSRQHASAGLALIEMYRDVKTGHPAEAIELFNRMLPDLRRQLGHRVADAHALAAKAYDLLGRAEDAAGAYDRATLLSPEVELHRRYPEVATLAGKYPPAAAPAAA